MCPPETSANDPNPADETEATADDLARAWLPVEIHDFRCTAFLFGYNVQVATRCLDDGLTFQVVVNRGSRSGEDEGDYCIAMADYFDGSWVIVRQGTGHLPNVPEGREVAVRPAPITSLLSQIGTGVNEWNFVTSTDPERDAQVRAEHNALYANSTYDTMVTTEVDYLVHASQSDDFWSLWDASVLAGFASTITNRVVGTQHQCTLKANRVDEDGDETGEAIIVTSIYCDGEWTVYPSLTGIVEGDSPVRPAGTEELVEYMAERVNDWDFADDVIEDEIIELTDDRRKTMRRALAQTANLPVTDLRDLILSLPVRQAVTDDHQGLDYRSVWYSSQREHIAGWLDEYDGRGAYNRKNPSTSSKAFYGRFKCAPGLLWLAEALGEDQDTCRRAIAAADEAGPNPASECGAFRKVVPWSRIIELLDARLAK